MIEPLLKMANQALRVGDFRRATMLYRRFSARVPALDAVTEFNTALARKRGLRSLSATALSAGKKRAVIFAAYSRLGRVEDYVCQYLGHLRSLADFVVMVADCAIDDSERSKLDGLVDATIFQPHGEYDFGSYKRGYQLLVERGVLDRCDELIFCNDSCYGPLHGFAWMFHEMADRPVDFWGITQNSEFADHIQSYFMVFNRRVFSAAIFKDFFLSIKREASVQEVILNYEVGLTGVLSAAGFAWDTFINPTSPGMAARLKRNTNPTVFPIFLAEQGAQLVKVKATRGADCNFEGIDNLLGCLAQSNLELFDFIHRHEWVHPPAAGVAPFFSMILPVYNRRGVVSAAIDSVLGQEYGSFELVVVDDGSTDGTVDVIRERYGEALCSGRMRLVRCPSNEGVSAARNIGLRAARGEWIAYVDSDNSLRAGFFQAFAEGIANDSEAVCFYGALYRTSAREVSSRGFDYADLLRENYIDLGVFVHRKDLLAETGYFDGQLKRLVDWDFIIRATRVKGARPIEQVVVNYHDSLMSVDRISCRESYDAALGVIRRKYGIPYTVTCVVIAGGCQDELAVTLEAACSQHMSFLDKVLVFDNGLSPATWPLIQQVAARYPDLLAGHQRESPVGDLQNALDAAGAARSDFVAFWTAGDDTLAAADSLQRLAEMLIAHPEWPLAIAGSAVCPDDWRASFPASDREVRMLSGRMYRRHVLEQLRFERSRPAVPKISFVIPLFNHLEATQAMLISLQASLPAGLDYEIILTDDASTDGTVDWLKTLHDPRIKVLLSEQNRGYAANNNAGVKLARGEVLGLLNNDLLFEPGWLEPMLAALLASELNAGLVGNVQYRVADGAVDHAGVCLAPNAHLAHIQQLPVNSPTCSNVLAVTGACMLLRKADFQAMGGFDEQFVNGGEDIDLCFKSRGAGKAIYVANQSRIFHHVSLSRTTNTLQDLRNSRILFSRWRKEIKQELSAVWHDLLKAGPAAYADKLSGQLAAEFLSSPHAASRVIAEAMLRREDVFVASKLDDTESVKLPKRVTTRGLRFDPQQGGYWLEESAEFVVEALPHVRNFYVCGRRMDDLSQPMVLTIHVNGVQSLRVPLKAERNLNVGVVDPLLLPGIANCFRVETSAPLLLTHWVVDDHVVGG